MPAVHAVALPAGTLIEHAFARPDYADAYAARLPPGAPADIDALVVAALTSAPAWVGALMALRDRVVRLAGLKTMPPGALRGPRPRDLETLAQRGLFKVYARAEDEVLLGLDDRHLDFRVSVLRAPISGGEEVVVSTVVRFNGWLGRLYFLPVRFFHRLVVPAMLRRGLRTLANGA
ncbi:hypothetical protein SE17_15660 [Kouleothrix aurantiaca]|uniref:DUF2867 domain-containing protein n=1 Tax=Kouleothrix aurantiaca TaxID=186479 RepID=A0A0P9D0M8_9CHLR|nr:hypothetical protein SE17_15660 [Kouleothrix aurantiaca]